MAWEARKRDQTITIRCTQETYTLWRTFVAVYSFRTYEDALRWLLAKSGVLSRLQVEARKTGEGG